MRLVNYTNSYRKSTINCLMRFLADVRGETINRFFGIDVEPKKVAEHLDRIENAETFFLLLAVNNLGRVVGGLHGRLDTYWCSYDIIATDIVFFLEEEYTDLQTVTKMVRLYEEWAKRNGARTVQLCSSTGLKSKKFAALLRRLGYSNNIIGGTKEI